MTNTEKQKVMMQKKFKKQIEEANAKVDGEIWKDIKGYEGLYKISNKGRIKGLYGLMTPQLSREGYYQIMLRKDNKSKQMRIHRLVLNAFGEPPRKNQKYVNHKDLNKKNNNIENLEWVTAKENSNHYEKNRNISKYNSIVCYDENGNKFNSYNEAAKAYNIAANTVKNDCTKGAPTKKVSRMTFHL